MDEATLSPGLGPEIDFELCARRKGPDGGVADGQQGQAIGKDALTDLQGDCHRQLAPLALASSASDQTVDHLWGPR